MLESHQPNRGRNTDRCYQRSLIFVKQDPHWGVRHQVKSGSLEPMRDGGGAGWDHLVRRRVCAALWGSSWTWLVWTSRTGQKLKGRGGKETLALEGGPSTIRELHQQVGMHGKGVRLSASPGAQVPVSLLKMFDSLPNPLPIWILLLGTCSPQGPWDTTVKSSKHFQAFLASFASLCNSAMAGNHLILSSTVFPLSLLPLLWPSLNTGISQIPTGSLLAPYSFPEGPTATASVTPGPLSPSPEFFPQSRSEYPTVCCDSSVCPRPPPISTFPGSQPVPPLHSGHTLRWARTQARSPRLSLSCFPFLACQRQVPLSRVTVHCVSPPLSCQLRPSSPHAQSLPTASQWAPALPFILLPWVCSTWPTSPHLSRQ